MIEKLPNRDGLLVMGELRENTCECCRQRYLPAFHQQENSGGCELFADGADFENRRRRIGNRMFQIGHAIRGGEGIALGSLHADGAPRCVRVLICGKNLGDLLGARRLGE